MDRRPGDQEFRSPTGDFRRSTPNFGIDEPAESFVPPSTPDLLISGRLQTSGSPVRLQARAPSLRGFEQRRDRLVLRQLPAQRLQRVDQAIQGRQHLVGVGARRCRSRSAPGSPRRASCRPARNPTAGARLPHRLADDVHQRAGGQLRQMAGVGQDVIVRRRIDDDRCRAQRRGRRRPAVPGRTAGVAASGVSSHGRRSNRSAREASSPPRARPGQRMAADERQRSAADARAASTRRALGAADIGDQRRPAHDARPAAPARRCSAGQARPGRRGRRRPAPTGRGCPR